MPEDRPMFRLSLTNEMRWLELPMGVRVEVRPLTTAIVEAAASEALKRVALLQVEASVAEKAGQPYDKGGFNGANSSAMDGLWNQYRAEALARYGVNRWEGVGGPDGNPLPPSPQAIEAFAAHPALAREFVRLYAQPVAEIVSEGNGLGAGFASPTPEETNTAEDAQTAPKADTAAEPAQQSATSPKARKAGRS